LTVALPKVAICFPSADMVHADFALALAGLCNAAPPLETPIVNNKSSIVAAARNDGVRRARELGCDHILFLDTDMTFPRTTLHRLLVHREAIVGATYVKRVAPFALLGSALEAHPTADARGLTEMSRIPTGCLLIRMRTTSSAIARARRGFASGATPRCRWRSATSASRSAASRARRRPDPRRPRREGSRIRAGSANADVYDQLTILG